jgi:hypothetical protein
MPTIQARRTPSLAYALAIGAVAAFAPRIARAHDVLLYPPPWLTEGAYGDPQKVAPCGVDSTITYTPTNTVTTFAPGQTITLKWQETIAHDGWFRIALSYNNRTDLVDPATDPSSPQSNPLAFSKDASIESPPVAPVLVDGLYPHTAASITTPKMYTYDLKRVAGIQRG